MENMATKKIIKKVDKLTAGDTTDLTNQMLRPNQMSAQAPQRPMVSMSPSMMTAIKQSPKGKIPPGLARYLAMKKKGKK